MVARALEANAFRTPFITLDQLLTQPLFNERTIYIPLPWKDDLVQTGMEIFPLSY